MGATDMVRASTTRFIEEQPVLKVASSKIHEGTEAMSKEVKGVVDDTTRLIREREQARTHAPGSADSVGEQQPAETTTTTTDSASQQPQPTAEATQPQDNASA